MENADTKNRLEPNMWSVRYRDYLCRMARKKLPEHLVEDLVQDTFLAALNAARNYKGEASERVWLTAILKNKIMDFYRTANTRQGKFWYTAKRESDFAAWRSWEGSSDTESHNNVTADLFARELDGVIQKGFKKLGNRERQVLGMRIKGFSTEAICHTLEIKETASWVALSRARRKIKSYLSENWYEVA